jgi:hypothetical protein
VFIFDPPADARRIVIESRADQQINPDYSGRVRSIANGCIGCAGNACRSADSA